MARITAEAAPAGKVMTSAALTRWSEAILCYGTPARTRLRGIRGRARSRCERCSYCCMARPRPAAAHTALARRPCYPSSAPRRRGLRRTLLRYRALPRQGGGGRSTWYPGRRPLEATRGCRTQLLVGTRYLRNVRRRGRRARRAAASQAGTCRCHRRRTRLHSRSSSRSRPAGGCRRRMCRRSPRRSQRYMGRTPHQGERGPNTCLALQAYRSNRARRRIRARRRLWARACTIHRWSSSCSGIPRFDR
jgi:hypothetical protein